MLNTSLGRSGAREEEKCERYQHLSQLGLIQSSMRGKVRETAMIEARYLGEDAARDTTSEWVYKCAFRSGWDETDSERLAKCVADSADAVSSAAYCKSERGPVFVKLDVRDDAAILELHHEGALGERPCDCVAAKAASEHLTSVWADAQLRMHRLKIKR